MDTFHERLIVRAATVDELLSDDFEPATGQKGDTDLATRRLAAWCRSSTGGDWALFSRRLARDGLALDDIKARFSGVRRKASAVTPEWVADAIWIEAALRTPDHGGTARSAADSSGPVAFEHLFTPLLNRAEELLHAGMQPHTVRNLTESAQACLHHSLLRQLSELCVPAVYELFVSARKAANTEAAKPGPGRAVLYDRFVADMKAGGFRRLFEDKPILLRLIAVITRQWIETSQELLQRLEADLPAIRRNLLRSSTASPITKIEGDLSDPHNGGRSVRIISFADGSRVLYKPKDLRLDVVWHALIEKLNRAGAPIELKAVAAIAAHGYGWTEFISHTGCADQEGYKRFFRRAGAWLALFHCFVASDMHQENMIASGEHPIPIDLETILQSNEQLHGAPDPEAQAFDLAAETLANSVMMIGMLPAYGRSPENKIFAIGGMTADWNSKIKIKWDNINSDEMRPTRSKESVAANPNLPHVDGRYAKFGEYVEDFVAGFEDYAKFLMREGKEAKSDLLHGFAGLPVRKVLRATRFYSMLLQRLKNHRAMDDGVQWSAQADFVARLAEWDKDVDDLWPLHRAERAVLLTLNIPHFISPTDGSEIRDAAGFSVSIKGESGLDRARARIASLDQAEIAWQVAVIRENTSSLQKRAEPKPADDPTRFSTHPDVPLASAKKALIAEADTIASELARNAIRKGPGAAWIGLDWLGDAEVFQLVSLGPDLYNGASGIALFLAAHAAVTGHQSSRELALAGLAHVRKNLKSRNAARMARSLGIGGATGLGSIVYALSVISGYLRDNALLEDAHAAAGLFTDELIAADKQLDVIGGSAGAILSLLRLYRDSQAEQVLTRAIKCGEHLMVQSRLGAEGRRSWVGQGLGENALNGMSHGAAGFAYALAALSSASGRKDFAQAAAECLGFENASYDAARNNWPDLRTAEPAWPCQWCHGAPGIGLARIATARRGQVHVTSLEADIENAVEGTAHSWPGRLDTLCCGTLGSIEFFCEAGAALGRDDLRQLALQRMMAVLGAAASAGDYRWNSGKRRFNLGLFRGLAGVGYTALRQADNSLANVLIWE